MTEPLDLPMPPVDSSQLENSPENPEEKSTSYTAQDNYVEPNASKDLDQDENSENLTSENKRENRVKDETQPLKKTVNEDGSTSSKTTMPVPVIKPSLRGKYTVLEDGNGVWEGQWGMDDSQFEPGGVLSPFHYTSRPAGNDVHNKANIADAVFSGHFMMGSTVPGHPSTKHVENGVEFQFFDTEDDDMLKVVGQGKNQFGSFELDGTYNLDTKELICYRVYAPKPLKGRKSRVVATRKSYPSTPAPATTVEKSTTGLGKRPRPTPNIQMSTPSPVFENAAANRSSRVRRAPSHLVDAVDADGDGMMYKLRNVLLNLMSNDKEGWFIVPVDAEALNIPTYHTVIKKPMDLGTIKKRMDASQYESYEQIIEDIRLTFNNACLFNPKEHPVHKVASQHLRLFENELKKMEKPIKKEKSGTKKKTVDGGGRRKRTSTAQPQPKKPAPERPNPFGSSSEEEEAEDEDSDMGAKKKKKTVKRKAKEDESSEIKMLRKQVEMMNKQIGMMQQMQEQNLLMSSLAFNAPQNAQTISAPPAVSQPKKREMRPLSYQEKRQLGQDIHKLPGEMIGGVIRIIQESGAPLGGDGDEVELDIEALDTPSLKKLQKYVRKCLAKVRSKKSKEELDSMIMD